MSLAVTPDHHDLAAAVQSLLRDRGVSAQARAALDATDEQLPSVWADVVAQGWLGLHLPERLGGEGYSIAETAIVLEQMGRVNTPGPFLPTVVASATLARHDVDPHLIRPFTEGVVCGLGLFGSLAGDRKVSGDAGPVLGATVADWLLLTVGPDLVLVHAAGTALDPGTQLDPTRRSPTVSLLDAPVVARISGGRSTALNLLRALWSAEAAGGARAVTEMTADYARTREQFGRPIGGFQLVKGLCADMLCATEVITALAWDAAQEHDATVSAQTSAAAGALAPAAFLRAARIAIQLHGGIGFTWEHDAHLFLRRAEAMQGWCQPEDASATLTTGASQDVDTVRRPALAVPDGDPRRVAARTVASTCLDADLPARRRILAETGYLVPHWPRPWGLSADVVEQLLIEQELAAIDLPDLGIGGWVLMTIAQVGTPEQCERWIPRGLAGEETWCQMFSEPGAGSDAAAVTTRGEPVDGGWRVTGQKIWTSGAQHARFGMATVRTDRDTKHAGITMMVIDLHSDGVTVRPITEMTGDALFNEIFLDDVFVPDADVLGAPGEGWKVARSTLGNERVTIGEGYVGPPGTALDLLPRLGAAEGVGWEREVGPLLAERNALRAINLRRAARAIEGGEPGREGAITKLLHAEHTQRCTDLGLRLAGHEALAGADATIARGAHFSRALTIAGGASEILRSQIAETMLGLPREPRP